MATAFVPDGIDAYAVTVKPQGVETIEISELADYLEFSAAFDKALEVYGYATYLGVFHDDDKHTIDFDPVEVVSTTHEVDKLAETYPVIGGAYNFRTGNGYWPQGR